MKLSNCLDETLCGLLIMKVKRSDNQDQIQLKIKGSLFGDDTCNEHQFNGAASLSIGNLLQNSQGIIDVSITLDELEITQGKVLFTVTDNDNGILSATFARWNLECGDEDQATAG